MEILIEEMQIQELELKNATMRERSRVEDEMISKQVQELAKMDEQTLMR